MITYKCLGCGCIHGWGDRPQVTKVTRHVRYPGEDVWYCPKCNREHRTTDGTMLGQPQKLWREVDADEPPDEHLITGDGIILKVHRGSYYD